jgi:hypothetical protein
MTNGDEDALLATLPRDVEAPMREALALLDAAAPAKPMFDENAYPGIKITQSPATPCDADALVVAAFEAARFPPHQQMLPMAEELDDTQRALAVLVAHRDDVPLHRFAIPQTAWARRRWLGIDSATVTERAVDFEVNGTKRRAPLWRALTEVKQDRDAAQRLFDALSIAERADAYCDLALGAYRVEPPFLFDLASLDGSAGAWASAFADRLTALFAKDASHGARMGHTRPPWSLPWVVFIALARGAVVIEPRWDWLLPTGFGEMEPFAREVAAAIPEPRRGAALANALGAQFTTYALRAGAWLVESFPSKPLVEHLIARADEAIESLACPPRRDYLASLAKKLEPRPELRDLVLARLTSLPPLPTLRTTRSFYAKTTNELTPGLRMQVALARGEDGEAPADMSLQYLSAFEIAGADGTPAYEALLFMDEDGMVCVVGTTRAVAYVSQENISTEMGEPLLEALHALLYVRPPERRDA